jgi:hypothetical protein
VASAAFSAFRAISNFDVPTDILIDGPPGRVHLTFDQIEVNEPLLSGAFQPPRTARKIR